MIYYVLDNGARPFKVSITKGLVSVYRDITDWKNNWTAERLPEYSVKAVKTFTPEKVFIGKSPLNDMTEFSAGHGSKFNGNTVLLSLPGNVNVVIGMNISSFKSVAPIKKYISPVGNNGVPYPYAIDSQGNYYLVYEDVTIKPITTPFVEYMKNTKHDPYTYYYENNKISGNLVYTPPPYNRINRRFIEKYKKNATLIKEFGDTHGYVPLKMKVLVKN